jgi:hypothetical protein
MPLQWTDNQIYYRITYTLLHNSAENCGWYMQIGVFIHMHVKQEKRMLSYVRHNVFNQPPFLKNSV